MSLTEEYRAVREIAVAFIRRGLFCVAAAGLLAAWPQTCRAAFDSSAAGTSAGQFLELGSSARAAAMGEAISAAVDDAAAVRYNPAALGLLKENSLSLMHALYLQSISIDDIAYARRLGDASAAGLDLSYVNYGSIEKTDASDTPLGAAHPSDLAATAAYSRRIDAHVPFLRGGAVGISLAYVKSRIVSEASTFAGSFGLITPAFGPREGRLAFVAQNIGGSEKFDKTADPLPLTFRLGGAIRPVPAALVTGELVLPRDSDPYGAIGAEYQVGKRTWPQFVLRAGLNTRTLSSGLGLSGISLGFGIAVPATRLDYAFVPFGDLGYTHRLSVTFRFLRPTDSHPELPPKPAPVPPARSGIGPWNRPPSPGKGL